MDTTGVGGESPLQQKHKFTEGDAVFNVVKSFTKADLVKSYNTFHNVLDLNTWWKSFVKITIYDNDIEVIKLENDPERFYVINTSYIGFIKPSNHILMKDVERKIVLQLDDTLYKVRWEYRKDSNSLLPGLKSEHDGYQYGSLLVPISKITILSIQELVENVLSA